MMDKRQDEETVGKDNITMSNLMVRRDLAITPGGSTNKQRVRAMANDQYIDSSFHQVVYSSGFYFSLTLQLPK